MGVSEPEKGGNKAWIWSGKVFLETGSGRKRERFILYPATNISGFQQNKQGGIKSEIHRGIYLAVKVLI